MEPVGKNIGSVKIDAYVSGEKKKNGADEKKPGYIVDSAEISNASKAFKKLDDFLNLGNSDRLNIDDLNPKEKDEFLKMLADLIKKGVIGYEVLDVNGKPEKHYIDLEIGDKRIYGAKLYKKNDDYYNRKD
jgi:hypothetical protein